MPQYRNRFKMNQPDSVALKPANTLSQPKDEEEEETAASRRLKRNRASLRNSRPRR